MKKILINITKYLVFLIIGVLLFLSVYHDIDFEKLKIELKNLNYFWIFLSLVISLIAQFIRAVRWNMLIESMNYKPKVFNTFLSVMVLYMVNLLIPRAGEIGRCTVLSKYESIPFAKLVGTVFIERTADFVAMIILAIVIFTLQFKHVVATFDKERISNVVNVFSSVNQVKQKSFIDFKDILIYVGIFLLLVYLIIIIKNFFNKKQYQNTSLKNKILEIKYHLLEGIKSIVHLKKRGLFVVYTFLIFLMWLLMLYVVFLAYSPTKHMTIIMGATAFMMGGVSMLLPVQGGIGPWHLMVILTLNTYGLNIEKGAVFALIAHTTTILVYFIFGIIALILFALINKKNKYDYKDKKINT